MAIRVVAPPDPHAHLDAPLMDAVDRVCVAGVLVALGLPAAILVIGAGLLSWWAP